MRAGGAVMGQYARPLILAEAKAEKSKADDRSKGMKSRAEQVEVEIQTAPRQVRRRLYAANSCSVQHHARDQYNGHSSAAY